MRNYHRVPEQDVVSFLGFPDVIDELEQASRLECEILVAPSIARKGSAIAGNAREGS
jgi:hypothetical protein